MKKKKLLVFGGPWKKDYTFTHKGVEYHVSKLEEARTFAKKKGYKGIWVTVE